MAINGKTEAPVEPTVETQQHNPGKGWSFHTGSMFGAPINRSVGSESYNKLKASLAEAYKNTTDKNIEIAILDLDNANEPSLAFSSLVIAMRFKNNLEKGVAFHILMMEATGDKLIPISETINNQQVEIHRVPGDAFDDILIAKATEKVRKAFPTGPWYCVDGCVIPTDFNPDDIHKVHSIALNAGLALGTELETRTEGFQDVNLASAENDSTLNINIGFNRQQLDDAVGNKMRSDVLVNFDSRKNNGSVSRSVNSGDREVKISEISSFMDLVWSPVEPSGFNPYAQQQQQGITQKYAARLVITNLASNHSYTTGSVLLALSTAMTLRDDNNWIQAFRPNVSGNKEIDMNDIGALNIEANLSNEPAGYGTRIDTKSDAFKLEDLGQLVAALVRPGLMISLDCPEVGPQSWYLSIFAAASNGSSNAYRAICESANQLTNGSFGNYFQPGTPMFADVGNRIHNGQWTDKNGAVRDIRDFSHLAVCNLIGERDPQFIKDWSDTFLKTQYPLPMRLAARKRMIESLSYETATFDGFSQRVTFSGVFLDALSKAIRDTGMPVKVNTPLNSSDFNNQRGIGSFVNGALLAPGQSFNAAPGYNYNYQPAGGNNYRW